MTRPTLAGGGASKGLGLTAQSNRVAGDLLAPVAAQILLFTQRFIASEAESLEPPGGVDERRDNQAGEKNEEP